MLTISIRNIDGWYHVIHNGVTNPIGYRRRESAQMHALAILDGWI